MRWMEIRKGWVGLNCLRLNAIFNMYGHVVADSLNGEGNQEYPGKARLPVYFAFTLSGAYIFIRICGSFRTGLEPGIS